MAASVAVDQAIVIDRSPSTIERANDRHRYLRGPETNISGRRTATRRERGSGGRAMPGIHHVTAISGKAERNVAFYAHVLGLRLVKRTVNFDDPGTYHLYYGDEAGRPGTILTFFPWEHAAAGRAGVGSAQATSFRVP